MIRTSVSVCVDAPISTVWAALSDLESIHVWSESIQKSYCVSEHTRGVDTIRICELGGNLTIRETVTEWEEGTSFTYIGEGIPLIRSARNRWSVEEIGTQTLVTSSSEVEIKGGVFGRLVEPLMLLMIKRIGRNSLAAFKYLAENGKPYEGNAKKLGPVPAGC